MRFGATAAAVARTIVVLASSVGLCAPATAAVPRYTVGAVRFEMAPETKVGHRRAGLICAPAGSILWRDAAPDPRRAAAIVAHVLSDEGVDVYVPDDEWIEERAPASPRRIMASVAAVELNACTRQYGFGRVIDRRATLKGSGRMRVRWRVYDVASRSRLFETETCSRFDFEGDAMTPATAVEAGLAKSARGVASAVKWDATWSPALVGQPGSSADCPPTG